MSFVGLVLIIVLIVVVAASVALYLSRGRVPNIASNSDIKRLFANGETVKAVKAYRQLHGASLKEARQFIGELIANAEARQNHDK